MANLYNFPDNPDMDRWNLTTTDAPMFDDLLKDPEYFRTKKWQS